MMRATQLATPETQAVRAVLGPQPPVPVACGVEHEFRVSTGGQRVDFRTMIHTLQIPGRRLDPHDPNAYRCSWGGSLTADGQEAEIATPPIPLRPGFAGDVTRSAARGRRFLEGLLPPGHRLTGYSTHINVSVPDGRSLRVARRFADRFAVGVMLLMDDRDSPGLLIRPRPCRLELGGEYREGDALRAAILMAAGAALRCTTRSVGRPMPPRVLANVEPAVERFGLYVDRRAFGDDLYESGRSCRLSTRTGVRTAQRQLQDCWRAARVTISPYATLDDLALVDELVQGGRPLPVHAVPMAEVAR